MNAVAAIRIAKLVALLGFVLPWLLVSCSNQPIMTASGLDLAMGSFNFHNPANGATEHHSGSPDILVVLAIAAAVGGLLLSFAGPARSVMGGLLATSAAGLAPSYFGLESAKSAISQQLAGEAARQNSQSLQGLLVFQSQTGFTVTIVGMGAALAISLFAIWSARASEVEVSGSAKGLAGGPQASPVPAATASPAGPACAVCGAPLEPGARFCSGCGSAVGST
jgi:hypothetical protein